MQNEFREVRHMEEKNEMSLSGLLEQDREMVMTQLKGGRMADQALGVLEKEADRLIYRASDMESGESETAQGMLQVLKNMLPLVGAVSEAEVWEKEISGDNPSGLKVPLRALICGIAGIVCIIAGMIGPMSVIGLSRIFQVIWAAAGCGLLLLAGYFTGRGGGRDNRKKGAELQQTFLVDPGRIWNILQGTLLGADHSLELARERRQAVKRSTASDPAGGVQRAELQFFADLLENAYVRRRQAPSDDTLVEQIENIRYYLHTQGIETEDYSKRSAALFELLPGEGAAVTIRPALLQGGVVIMKGIASGS